MAFLSPGWQGSKSLCPDQVPELACSFATEDIAHLLKSANWSWFQENGSLVFFLNPESPVELAARRDAILACLEKVTHSPWRLALDGRTIILKPLGNTNWATKWI